MLLCHKGPRFNFGKESYISVDWPNYIVTSNDRDELIIPQLYSMELVNSYTIILRTAFGLKYLFNSARP